MLGKRDLFLQGIVKGATNEFPAKYLDNCQYQRGDHHAATATIEDVPMIALGWKGKTLRRFLLTLQWKASHTQGKDTRHT